MAVFIRHLNLILNEPNDVENNKSGLYIPQLHSVLKPYVDADLQQNPLLYLDMRM
jgi:hypothetical protein